jgi:hypothetical protein
MQCPHCAQQTDPTLAYCMSCGEQIELDPEAIQDHLEKDEEAEAIEYMEGQTRGGLYACAFLLVCVVAFRLIVVCPIVADVGPGYYGSAQTLDDKGLEPQAALDLPQIPVDIPDWR